MKTITFRPLRYIKKSGIVVVASYMQWRKVKTADYGRFKLIVDTKYRELDKDLLVCNHKGENLFWENCDPDLIPLFKGHDLVDGERPAYPKQWKTNTGMYSVKGLDIDGVPTFTNNTSLNVSNYDNIENFEPLTVGVVVWWFGWFLYQLNNNDLILGHNAEASKKKY